MAVCVTSNNRQDFYSKDTFILPVNDDDTKVRLQNIEEVLRHTLSPDDVVTLYVQANTVKIKTRHDLHTLWFTDNPEAIEALTCLRLALDQVTSNIADGPSGGCGCLLGLPTDGAYGSLFPSIAGVASGDRPEDAFDKITTFLERLIPEPPANLSTIVMTIPAGYSALKESTGTTHIDITKNPTETLTAAGFGNGNTGSLTANINGTDVGTVALTVADDTGLNNNKLTIINDVDPHLGVLGAEGHWYELDATIITSAPNQLNLGTNNISLTHTETGSSNKIIYLDDPTSPVVSNINITSPDPGRYISGVLYLEENDVINANFDLDNVISEYYHLTNVGAFNGISVASGIYQPPSAPAKGATVSTVVNTTVQANVFERGAVFNVIGQASDGTLTTEVHTSNLIIDSISDESPRVVSGNGQYPLSGTYGGAFDSSNSILGNEELQMYNTKYRFPEQHDYTVYYPSSVDYTLIDGGLHNDMRWVTFQPITITNEVGLVVELPFAENFGANALVSGFEMYVKVEGETGWLNANGAYPGVGTPVSDGDNCLAIGLSSATNRRITFSVVRTGQVYIRIGLPEGSDKAFGNINVTLPA